MILTNEMNQRVDVTAARTLRRVTLAVDDLDAPGRPEREHMLITLAEARALRDLLNAMDLRP